MTDRPLVSVVITNYNYGRFLRESVQSALDQSYDPVEVIVVDDGSTDDSRSILSSLDGPVRTIFQDNQGQAGAFNAGIAASGGAVVCLLDADDLWGPRKVEGIVSAFRGDCVLVHHRVQTVDVALQAIGAPWPRTTYRRALRRRALQSGGWWAHPPTSALSFCRRYLDRVLPVPSCYRLCADSYLASLAPHVGGVVGMSKPLALYRVHGDNGWTERDATAPPILERRRQAYEMQVDQLNQAIDRLGLRGRVDLDDHWPYRIVLSQLRGRLGPRDIATALRFPALPPLRRLTTLAKTGRAVRHPTPAAASSAAHGPRP